MLNGTDAEPPFIIIILSVTILNVICNNDLDLLRSKDICSYETFSTLIKVFSLKLFVHPPAFN